MPGSIDTMLLSANGWVPNNPRLPVLLYRRSGLEEAASFEARVAANHWPAQWRDGVFAYHHYHSTAHEALGCVRGAARLVLGGPNGRETRLDAGCVVVLPCGTGHCLIEASADFLVVGAYPQGQDWDVCRAAPDEAMTAAMARLPLPEHDPVMGAGGPLTEAWRVA